MAAELLVKQRAYFATGATRPLEFRLRQLSLLEEAIRTREEEIVSALHADFRKPRHESIATEIAISIDEIRFARKNLKKWMRPESRPTPLYLMPAKSRIHFEPLGCVFVIGPWNYPFQLAIAPLVGAIAAGNCVVLKPSELAPRTSATLAALIKDVFPEEYLAVREGGVKETTELLALKFDHVFFTGSTSVGKIIYEAAARNLTPVTLELGGKSPAIVCADADLDLAARRLAWGKFMNAGQTCVAPDYLYVQESVADVLLEKMKATIARFYGERPKESADFARIINRRNFDRLSGMIDPAKVFCGGDVDVGQLYISPTILKNATWEDAIMREEIFGPLLPVMTFKELGEAIGEIKKRDKPLAAYIFSSSNESQSALVEGVSFGGGCINDSCVHLGNAHLPFGGTGASGLGAYHGKKSFETFSHAKSVVHKSGWLDLDLRYPPYSPGKLTRLRWLLGLRKR